MRELVRSFRDAATFAQLRDTMQIDEMIARNVVNQKRQSIAPQLNAEHRQALQRVLREGTLSGGQSANVDVRETAASGLQRLSGYVRLPDRSAVVNLILPLARSNDAESRDVGYVSWRNLLATEPVSDESHALAGLSE